MNDQEKKKNFQDFLKYFNKNSWKEKSDGQIFFDRLIQSFGNAGVKEVGAVCEDVVKKKNKIGYIDFIWGKRVIIELKNRTTILSKHYDQALDYWVHSIPKTKYMILCNFDEFWIYDLNKQMHDPVHKLNIQDLPNNWGALNFLFPKEATPIFNNHNIEVTEKAAKKIGQIYYSLIKRGEDQIKSQRFILQIIVSLFAEDIGLIPKYTLQNILEQATHDPISQIELQNLFESMANDHTDSKSLKHKDIAFFNGGLFKEIKTIELNYKELYFLYEASKEEWNKVRPSIFGSIFETSMEESKRHSHGIHYTSEIDIEKIIYPTIIEPFKKKIKKAKTKKDCTNIIKELYDFKVLDPACGCGNFLYIAFRELNRLLIEVLEKRSENFDLSQKRFSFTTISPKNFYGIDTNSFGLELAKVSLSIGKKLVFDEFNISDEQALPFDNLDENFINEDALFIKWPECSAIVSNPPYLGFSKMDAELGKDYVDKIRNNFKDISSQKIDYCVYWFRKTHDHLKKGQRAGLVGTNVIRTTNSRKNSLDYIVDNKGIITNAVSTQVWSGEANVHVSIVNWIKGEFKGKKKLYTQLGNSIDSDWKVEEIDCISSALKSEISTKDAKILNQNKNPKKCFQGQTTGSDLYLIKPNTYKEYINKDSMNRKVLFPFLIGREIFSKIRTNKKFVINFEGISILEAANYKNIFNFLEKQILPEIQKRAKTQTAYADHLKKWWTLFRGRPKLIKEINNLSKYIATSRTSKKHIFDFVSCDIHPGDSIQNFIFDDDYSFGILQSSFHCGWIESVGGTLKGDHVYKENVFLTFPWPQNPTIKQVKEVALVVKKLLELREDIMITNNWGLRDLYNTLETEGTNPLREIHEDLDQAVRLAYGMDKKKDTLEFLLNLNLELFKKEAKGLKITSPGLPLCVKNSKDFIFNYCIHPSKEYKKQEEIKC